MTALGRECAIKEFDSSPKFANHYDANVWQPLSNPASELALPTPPPVAVKGARSRVWLYRASPARIVRLTLATAWFDLVLPIRLSRYVPASITAFRRTNFPYVDRFGSSLA
jgi:hypothetical protein